MLIRSHSPHTRIEQVVNETMVKLSVECDIPISQMVVQIEHVVPGLYEINHYVPYQPHLLVVG